LKLEFIFFQDLDNGKYFLSLKIYAQSYKCREFVMSAGGAFTLIANDGKSDRMLMATALLNERIHAIS